MITFGYKNQFSGVLRALAAIVIGLLMLANTGWTRFFVQIVGAFLVASGVFSLLVGLQKKKEKNSWLNTMMHQLLKKHFHM